MKGKVMIIFDKDSLYATRLQQFLCNREGNYFKVLSFTNETDLYHTCMDNENIKPEILLVSESSFHKKLSEIGAKHIFILNETGLRKYSEYVNLNKYQSAGVLFQQILLEYADKEKEAIPRFHGNKRARIIGVYTPVTRCLQTSFSMALSQVLGKKGKTLYLNFEQYSGFTKLFQKGYLKDLSDLVYFFTYSRDKFLYWLEGVVEHFGRFDYVPPVLTATSLVEVAPDLWIEMLEFICSEAGYDYLVLDLSDSVQGIFNILDLCHRVYTITREDVISVSKMRQFQEILEEKQYETLKFKIEYIRFPSFSMKEGFFEDMIYGDLYEYVKRLLSEESYE